MGRHHWNTIPKMGATRRTQHQTLVQGHLSWINMTMKQSRVLVRNVKARLVSTESQSKRNRRRGGSHQSKVEPAVTVHRNQTDLTSLLPQQPELLQHGCNEKRSKA